VHLNFPKSGSPFRKVRAFVFLPAPRLKGAFFPFPLFSVFLASSSFLVYFRQATTAKFNRSRKSVFRLAVYGDVTYFDYAHALNRQSTFQRSNHVRRLGSAKGQVRILDG